MRDPDNDKRHIWTISGVVAGWLLEFAERHHDRSRSWLLMKLDASDI
jgi:hypothetical protein